MSSDGLWKDTESCGCPKDEGHRCDPPFLANAVANDTGVVRNENGV